MASLQSDNKKVVVCASREEMLETFEEYKRGTQNRWRCINSNALFGRFFIMKYLFVIQYVNCVEFNIVNSYIRTPSNEEKLSCSFTY